MNSKNTKTSELHRPWFNLADKINLKEVIKMLLYEILICTTKEKI